jgi:hypothetical protein
VCPPFFARLVIFAVAIAAQIFARSEASAPVPLFVAEGAPMPMSQGIFDYITMGPPRKILFGAAVTEELETYAVESATAIVQKNLN